MSKPARRTDQTGPALLRMSALLDTVGNDMTKVSLLVAALTRRHKLALTADEITALQTIDRICQTLRDLSVISEMLTKGDVVDADIRRLQLLETRSILFPDIDGSRSSAAGEVELFQDI